jgi:hypothetical protein
MPACRIGPGWTSPEMLRFRQSLRTFFVILICCYIFMLTKALVFSPLASIRSAFPAWLLGPLLLSVVDALKVYVIYYISIRWLKSHYTLFLLALCWAAYELYTILHYGTGVHWYIAGRIVAIDGSYTDFGIFYKMLSIPNAFLLFAAQLLVIRVQQKMTPQS